MNRPGYNSECPGCSSKKSRAHERDGVRICGGCGGLYTSRAIYRGDSPVLLVLHPEPNPAPKDLRYFDLDLLGSRGLERVHGWFHQGSRKVVQFG